MRISLIAGYVICRYWRRLINEHKGCSLAGGGYMGFIRVFTDGGVLKKIKDQILKIKIAVSLRDAVNQLCLDIS